MWREYKLPSRTRFNTKVPSVRRAKREDIQNLQDEDDLIPEKQGHSRWIINDGVEGVFDAVIVTIGTCGEPNMITLPGMSGYKENDKTKTDKRSETAKKQDNRDKGKKTVEKNGQEFQEEGDTKSEGSTSNDNPSGDSVWDRTKPRENAWDVNRDQIEKKEQGFPAPGEAFQPGPDVQEGSEEKSLLHHMHEDGDEDRDENEGKENGAPGREEENGEFRGPIIHSSRLDAEGAPSFKGKTVAVIGGGASAVEAVEAALAQGAKDCIILVRDDKVCRDAPQGGLVFTFPAVDYT